jgi:hypothetical protein
MCTITKTSVIVNSPVSLGSPRAELIYRSTSTAGVARRDSSKNQRAVTTRLPLETYGRLIYLLLYSLSRHSSNYAYDRETVARCIDNSTNSHPSAVTSTRLLQPFSESPAPLLAAPAPLCDAVHCPPNGY